MTHQTNSQGKGSVRTYKPSARSSHSKVSKPGSNEKPTPPSFIPTICRILSHSPSPWSGPFGVPQVCWGPSSHLEAHRPVNQLVSPSSSWRPGLWQGPGRSQALLECTPSFRTQTSDDRFLSKLLRAGDGNFLVHTQAKNWKGWATEARC